MKQILFFTVLIVPFLFRIDCVSAQRNTIIKKGDTWNMVLQNDISFELDNALESVDEIEYKFHGLDNLLAKADWKALCLESDKNKLKVKFTLCRLQAQGNFRLNDLSPLVFNDTDYPIYTNSNEEQAFNELIGKSFIYTWELQEGKGVVKITDDEFATSKLKLCLENVSSDKRVKSKITCDMELYGATGPQHVAYYSGFINTVQASFGNATNKECQNILQLEFGDTIRTDTINFSIDKFDEQKAYLKIDDLEEPTLIVLASGMPYVFFGNNYYMYNYTNIPNTNISGTLNNKKSEGKVMLDFEAPLYKKDTSVIVKNGEFEFSLDLREPAVAKLKIDDEDIGWLFIKPGMQVVFSWESESHQPSIDGIGAEDMECYMRCASLFYIDEVSMKFNEQNFSYWETRRNKIIEEYKDKLSADVKDFLKKDWCYFRGFCLSFSTKANLLDKNYLPEVDTLPLLTNHSDLLISYDYFASEYLTLKQNEINTRFGFSWASSIEKIHFAKLLYKGYPMYRTLYGIIKGELLNGRIDYIQKYYNEFQQYPIHPYFKNELKKVYSEMMKIQKGKKIPLTSFEDSEKGEIKIKGGELQILDINVFEYSDYLTIDFSLKQLVNYIEGEPRIDKLKLVVIRPELSRGKFEELSGEPLVDVEYIYLNKEEYDLLKPLQLKSNERILLLDKKLNIINNNIKTPYYNVKSMFPAIIDEYFESLNQPIIKAETRRLLFVLLASLLGFSILSWIVIRVRARQIEHREVTRRQLAELELRAIRSQMNPHFIFNSLNSIQNLVNKNKIEETNIYLTEFAEMMRRVLNNSDKQLVSIDEEVQLIESYLNLEKLRIPFFSQVIIDPSLIPENEEIPAMLIQPFVENAFHHGIAPQKGGEIIVKFKKENTMLICEIIDNGVGFSKRQVMRKGNGKAIKLVQDRFNIVNSQASEKCILEIKDRATLGEKGTIVRIEIPV